MVVSTLQWVLKLTWLITSCLSSSIPSNIPSSPDLAEQASLLHIMVATSIKTAAVRVVLAYGEANRNIFPEDT